mgnify:CR=1 FL=1
MEQYKMIDLMSCIGVLEMDENPVPFPEFYDKFVEFMESNKWYFNGEFVPVEKELQ